MSVADCDFLLLGHLFHAVQELPLLDGRHKYQIFRRLIHALCDELHNRLIIAVQKIHGLADVFPVSLSGNIALAGSLALLDMVIEAGPLLADIFREIPLTGADLVDFSQKLDGILHGSGAGVGAKIPALILFHRSGKKNPGVILVHGHIDEGIGLIVLEHRVVFWPVLLDEVALQNQCFKFRVRHNVLETPDPRHHLVDLGPLVPAGLKILTHPVFQGNSLSHIDDGILLIVHDIDARLPRQLFQFFLNIKHLCPPVRKGCRPGESLQTAAL